MRSTSFEIRKIIERNQESPRASELFVVTDSCDDYLACRICDHLLLRLFAATHFKVYRERECVELLRDAPVQKSSPTVSKSVSSGSHGRHRAAVKSDEDFVVSASS